MKNCFDINEEKTLLTGANGFIGQVIQSVSNKSQLVTLGLKNCDINVDLSKTVPNLHTPFNKIIHAAGKAHVVPKTADEEKSFYDINVDGTKNLLSAIEKTHQYPNVFIYISTVAVYGLEEGDNILETAPLNGSSPYAKSKIEAEKLLLKWGVDNNVKILILRLPLIIGSNAPGNFGNMVKAIEKGYYFRVGNGKYKHSMVLAEDVATFLISVTNEEGIYHLTDGYDPYFHEIEDIIAAKLQKRILVLPYSIAKLGAAIGDFISFIPINSLRLKKITSHLTFSDEKARLELKWNPSLVIEKMKLDKLSP